MENFRNNSCGCKTERRTSGISSDLSSQPLSMAYVPWQRWQDIYKPEDGLFQGTIFQELDLPFAGKRCQK